MEFPVLSLHNYPEYIAQCCELINDEWKRSTTSRLRSLESSCDKLPTNLILLKENKVIGHCKLSIIPSISDACFIESVVIDKSLRGKGYGKYLMTKAEEYCRNLSLKKIYLSTKDQELFYNKLGYHVCQPISIYGNSILCKYPVYQLNNITCKIDNKIENETKSPPPPPMPTLLNNSCTNSKVFMNKTL